MIPVCSPQNKFPTVNQFLPKNEQIEKLLLVYLLFQLVCLFCFTFLYCTNVLVNFSTGYTYLNNVLQLYLISSTMCQFFIYFQVFIFILLFKLYIFLFFYEIANYCLKIIFLVDFVSYRFLYNFRNIFNLILSIYPIFPTFHLHQEY